MKKFFKGFLAVFTVLTLALGSVAAVAEEPVQDTEKEYSIYVANETRYVTIGVICVVPRDNPEECLYSGVTLYTRSVSEKDDNKISSFIMHLPAGRYMFFMCSADKITQEIERFYLLVVVEEDGTLIFDDQETDV